MTMIIQGLLVSYLHLSIIVSNAFLVQTVYILTYYVTLIVGEKQ